MKKLITVLILSDIFVRGEMLKAGTTAEVNEREATELENRGKATRDPEGSENVSLNYNEMTLEELSEVDYLKLNKDDLVTYATAVGVETKDKTKADIYELLEAVDFTEE